MMLEKFKFKPVNESVVNHPLEKRGFVNVPFDYENPKGEQIKIFYRLIPAYDSAVDDASKPIIVVINGGPGLASSGYRALDFDYQNPDAKQNGPMNRFLYFLKTHRVLIADQRGTDGQSAPLDMSDRNLNPDLISKYFSSDFQARDYLAVIQKVIPANEEFLMIAQSYGGMVGMQYLSLPEMRKPKGIIFSCSALPYENMKEAMMSRRKEQHKLNLELKAIYPDISDRLARVREHLGKNSMDPNLVHGLYGWLGKNMKGVWEKDFVNHLEEILKKDRTELEKEFKSHHGMGNFLNYILSSCNFTPGHTDRTISRDLIREFPFEPWMVDENWILLQIGKGVDYQERITDQMDAKPPTATPFASVEDLRKAISKNQLLFTPADNDAFVPAETYHEFIQKFLVEGHTQIKRLPGGHHAIFLEKGYQALLDWSKTLVLLAGIFTASLSQAYTAKLTYFSGEVIVGTPSHWEKAVLRQEVKVGESVKTGKDATAILTTDDLSQLKLKENSELQLNEPKKNEVYLVSGSLFSRIKKAPETHFKVRTRTVTMGVRGTQFYTSYGEGDKHEGDVWMCVNEGLVAVESKDEKNPVLVKEGLGVFAPVGKSVTEPKPYAWTKELNWNMDPEKGDVADRTKIKAAYGDLLKHNYD